MGKREQKPEQDFSFLNDEDNLAGFEKIGATEQAIPFLRIAQKLSPQLDDQKAEYIEGLKAGQLFNTVTKESYGDNISIICGGFDHVYIEWPPTREAGGGPLAYHTPEHAEKIAVDKTFGKWKTESGNRLQETYIFYCIVKGRENEGLVILALKSTDIGVAKAWNRRLLSTMMPNGKKAKPYYMIWNLGSISVTNNQGSWFKLTVDFESFVDQEQYTAISQERQALPQISSLDFQQLEDRTGDVNSESEKTQGVSY